MKKLTIGIFSARTDAEKAINELHNKLDVRTDDISYIYKDSEGNVKEVDADDVASNTAGEGAKKGAAIGGTLGALAGIATVAGIIPIVGPIFAAGPIMALLGITGAVGTTAAGAVTGAAAGGIIGALVNLGVGKEKAQHYSDRVAAGDILVAVHSDDTAEVSQLLGDCGAADIEVYKPSV
jgi:uncharacterized membrane protein